MTTLATSAKAVKAALITVLEGLYPTEDVLVTYGIPGSSNQPDKIIGVMGQRLGIDFPTMGTNRSREESLETTVLVSVYQGGAGADAQRLATEAAWDLYDPLAERFRTAGLETLGGACRSAVVSNAILVEGAVASSDNPKVIIGRTADITVTVTTQHRIQ